MSRNFAELRDEALLLSPQDQLRLARALLEHASARVDSEAEPAWEQEIASRIKAIDSGEAKGRFFEDALADMDRRVGK